MRLEISVGVYNEDIEKVLKWFSWVKNPTKEDRETHQKFQIILNDLKREDKDNEDD